MPNIAVVPPSIHRREFQQALGQYERERALYAAITGDGLGNVAVTGRDRFIYVRIGRERSLHQAFNQVAPLYNNLAVWVSPMKESPRILEVVKHREVYIDTGEDIIAQVPFHHTIHEFPHPDTVYAQTQQLVCGLVYPTDPASMQVNVYGLWYAWKGGYRRFTGTISADLTGNVPTTGTQTARYVLISIDGETRALQYTTGDLFLIYMPPASQEDMIPDAPVGSVPVGAVYLPLGCTSVGWPQGDETGTIYDIRVFVSTVGDNVESEQLAPGDLGTVLYSDGSVASWSTVPMANALRAMHELDIELTIHQVEG